MDENPIQVASDVRFTVSLWRECGLTSTTVTFTTPLRICVADATMAVLLYDYLLTISSEVELIWERHWRWSSFLFYANRYWPILIIVAVNASSNLPGEHTLACRATYYWYCYACVVTQLTNGLILTLRVVALFDRNKALLWVLCLLLGSMVACQFFLVSLTIPKLSPVVFTQALIPSCVPQELSREAVYYWIFTLLVESVLFFLVCLKLVQTLMGGESTPGLLAILIRDSSLAYGGALVFLLLNAVVYATYRKSLYVTFTITVPGSQCIIGSRMMLNIREVARRRAMRSEGDIVTPHVLITDTDTYELQERTVFVCPVTEEQESQRVGSGDAN
ncbi:hypothetical protein BC835DRAFT_1517311 [Cytidiella melzeri]|nr:hypothetical protein BC835DRAFT_1517311 [Cytidiella melzeri]